MQLPLFPPDADWKATPVAELPSWDGAKRVSIDIESCDPGLTKWGPGVRREDSFIAGVAFAIEDGPRHYLPMRHLGGGNLNPETVIEYLRDQAKVHVGKGKIIGGANLPYDLDFLEEDGVVFRPEQFRDVQVAAPLCNELHMQYGLDDIAERLGIPGKDEALLREAAKSHNIHPKKELWKLHAKYVGAYAEQDAELPLKALRKLERDIEAQDLWQIYDLECRVQPALTAMRRRGVRIDFDRLDQVERWSVQQEALALAEIKRKTEVKIAVGDVWKAKAVAPALLAIGLDVPRTPKTKAYSIKDEFLQRVHHPVADLLRRARKVNKLRTTFAASIRGHATNGRIHTTFNQLRRSRDDESSGKTIGAAYGRLSSTNPNLQQQPARDPEIGPMWRSIYLPDEGGEWCCNDFSQQEPRWLTHYAELTGCAGAEHAANAYRNDPNTDNHAMMAELCGLPRKQAKELFLGKCYGMGDALLCRKLELPTEWVKKRYGYGMIEVACEEGQAIIDQFNRNAPYVTQLEDVARKQAEKQGFIRTVLGRRCRFPKTKFGYEDTRKALNRLVQGTSADHTKKAVVDAHEHGIPLQLQVHDELDMTIWEKAQAVELAEIMRESVSCNVPHVVDIEIGPSWGEIKGWKAA